MRMLRVHLLRFWPAFLVGGLLLGLVACGGGEEATPTSAAAAAPTATAAPQATATTAAPTGKAPSGSLTFSPGVINVGIGTPRFCTAGCAEDVYMASVLETFYRPKQGDFLGADPEVGILSTGWTLDPKLAYLDFKIRKGVPFHKDKNNKDWGTMTVGDVAYSFNDANSVTQKESIHGQAGDFAALFTRMEVIDDETVRIIYKVYDSRGIRHRFSLFWQTAGVLPKKILDEYGADGARNFIVGTGPYRAIEWIQNDKMVLEAVPNHWRQTPDVQRITFLQVAEPAARRAGLETGQLHAAPVSLKDRKAMEAKGMKFSVDLGFTAVRNFGMTGNYWEEKHAFSGAALTRKLDTAKPWVGDPKDPASMEKARKVRLAFAHAIDRQGLAASVMDGFGKPSYFAYEPPPDGPLFKKGAFPNGWEYPYDIAKAKALLKEAGYEKGFDMEVWIGPPGTTSELMTAMSGVWLADLGIKVTMDTNVYSTYRPGLVQRTTSKPFMSCGDDEKYNFPYDWARGFVMSSFSDGGYGVGMEIPFAADNYRAVAGEPDRQKRVDMNLAFTQKGIDEALCIGVVSEPIGFMYNPNNIASWDLLPMGNGNLAGMHNLEGIKLKR